MSLQSVSFSLLHTGYPLCGQLSLHLAPGLHVHSLLLYRKSVIDSIEHRFQSQKHFISYLLHTQKHAQMVEFYWKNTERINNPNFFTYIKSVLGKGKSGRN